MDKSRKQAIESFIQKWSDRGDEKQETQLFWLDFLEDVLGIPNARDLIEFEAPVDINGKTKYIDVLYRKQEILIEQKGSNISLNKRYQQSDGDMLTPFEQGRRYAGYLPYGTNIRWVIACNFKTIEIHDLKKPGEAPVTIKLENLEKDIGLLQFFLEQQDAELKRETEISMEAGAIVGRLYEALREKYVDPDNVESQRYLNILVTRLVFCMYCEDAGLFGDKTTRFQDYIQSRDPDDLGDALEKLFRVLDMTEDKRAHKSNLSSALRAFPYVNGGLFEEEDIEIPLFDHNLQDMLVKACEFDWSDISPTIFGAVFESTLNPETRRSGGMHYTSIENIHKVIDPLFLNDLRKEFREIQATAEQRGYKNRLLKFQEKLGSLVFLDPACGSGNFLTETFLSLRRLENMAITERFSGQQALGEVFESNPIKVTIDQFHGIEINDFAVTVARTALWIAEAQMLEETEGIIRSQIEFFPLKTNASIVEGNALRMNWNDVVSKEKLHYIMGNPPFRAMKFQSREQKEDIKEVFSTNKNAGSLDYVACWFKKAADFITDTIIKVALVSTNSIVQGEYVGILWKQLMAEGLEIVFAYKTFKWDSEANIKAHVHCVIIAFTKKKPISHKAIFDNGKEFLVNNINGYLMDAPNVFVTNRTKPLSKVPQIVAGNKPVDGDFLKINEEDYETFITREPEAKKYIKKLVGGYEFINNSKRYVLWLVGVPPDVIKSMPLVYERVMQVKAARLAMKDPGAIKLAETPTTFRDTMNPSQYIVVPIVSSERRRYVPMGFLDGDTIPTNQVQIIPEGSIYHFGILESNVHMAWMRAICGRLEMRYRYTAKIVYNNFPWPDVSEEQMNSISITAQAILDARELFPNSSLADLYDETLMPVELRRAHQLNDMAVMQAYGFYHLDENGKREWYKEDETVAALMQLYQKLVEKA